MQNKSFSSKTKIAIRNFVEQAIRDQIFPGVEVLFAQREDIILHEVYGNINSSANSEKLPKNLLFDLASITKPLATACSIMKLLEMGELFLEQQISKVIPEVIGTDKEKITIKQLLTHTAGFPAWSALYEPNWDQTEAWDKLIRIQLEAKPGETMIYSCLGFIMLGEIIRRVSGVSLSEFCTQQLYSPLGLNNLCFKPTQEKSLIVPTSYCSVRKTLLQGIVHDENGFVFNQEGGNAGLFGNAESVYQFCRMLLNGGNSNGTQIYHPKTIGVMFKNHNKRSLSSRALGWDYNRGTSGYMSCGDYMTSGAIGHLGFTGTSLWIHPKEEIIIIVLSSRVNIEGINNRTGIFNFRPKIHNLLLTGELAV